MIWLLFKNCGRKKDAKRDEKAKRDGCDGPQEILRELLPGLDADGLDDECDDRVFVTDAHFASLSVAGRAVAATAVPADDAVIAVEARAPVEDGVGPVAGPADDTVNGGEDAVPPVNVPRARVSEKRLEFLQCPFTWSAQKPGAWWSDLVDRVERKYGEYNCAHVSAAVGFSFEKYISNTIISCGLFKTNKVDRAHEKLTTIWNWLDKLDETYEPSYLAIRDGLKHIVMSALCHILYTSNKMQCQQLFEMITQFNHLNSRSRAAVYAIRSAVCIEIGGETLQSAVQYAKKACALDSDTAHWNYFHSVAMTSQRQYQNTCKSCPTEAEFDAIQHAIILSNEPNPYFNFHRMVLIENKILYHCYLNNSNSNVIENPSEQVKQDFLTVLGLIKSIVSMEPGDPHLIVKCAKSLMTLPYFNQDNIQLIKQVVSIGVNMAFKDSTVIQALKESIEIYKQLISDYKEIIKKKKHLESINILKPENKEDNKEDDLENDFKFLVNNYKEGSNPTLDFINLLDKYDGNNKWKIMAQLCSYSILFKTSENLLVSVEQFMMLTRDEEIARSEIVTCHRSIFVNDQSEVINLAELVCNEIKLAIANGCIKSPDQTRLYLDHLTTIMEVCRIKSKKLNPDLKSELLKCDKKLQQNEVPQIGAKNKKTESQKTKQVGTQNPKKQRQLKQNPNYNNFNNYHSRVYKPKTRRKNHRTVLKNMYCDDRQHNK